MLTGTGAIIIITCMIVFTHGCCIGRMLKLEFFELLGRLASSSSATVSSSTLSFLPREGGREEGDVSENERDERGAGM